MSDLNPILLEDINYKLDAILEGQTAMASVPGRISAIEDSISNIEGDINAIKSVVAIHSSELKNHEMRITKLEA